MKKHFSIFLALATSVLFFSCTKDLHEADTAPEDIIPEDGLILRLVPTGMDITTKATNHDPTRPGNWDGAGFNEEKFGSEVDVFFYTSSTDFNAPSVYNTRTSVRQVNGKGYGYVSLNVSAAEISTIFDGSVAGNKSYVFVAANYNGSEEIDHNNHYSVNQLRALSLATASWKTFPQESFVMISDNENAENPSPLVQIELTNPNSSTPASGNVGMKRVAAKVSFQLTVADSIQVVNVVRDQSGNVTDRKLETWTPVKNAMTAYMQYAMKVGELGGAPHTPPARVPLSSVPDDHESLMAYVARNLIETNDKISRTRTPVIGLTEDDPPQPIMGEPVTSDFNVYKVVSNADGQLGPFYTYPVTWTPGAAGEPFIKLVIPWNNGQRTKYYYYKIPFKSAPLQSNHWYEITLDVQILGGEDSNPVPLEATYKVVDWVPGIESEARVESARYLSVSKTEWIMYNTDELTIPITSSHDVQIVGYQVKSGGTAKGNAFAEKDKYDDNRKPLSDTWIGTNPSIYNPFTETLVTTGVTNQTTLGTINAAQPDYSGNNPGRTVSTATTWFPTASITRDQIVFRHTLNNDTSTSSYDIAPYYIRIRVRHKDDYNYYKDIIIEQRPAIVIEPQANSGTQSNYGYAYVNASNGDHDGEEYWASTSNITTYVNNYRRNWDYYLGSAPSGTGNSSNTNLNMYIIQTSVLPSSGDLSNYILSDPRTLSADNLNASSYASYSYAAWSHSGARLSGTGTKNLTEYLPADQSHATDNIIAPKIRIASSFGATQLLSYDNAFRRCASYQEDGYPAGRWRVPTAAEIIYIATLTSDGKIPRLLGSSTLRDTYNNPTPTTDYWCNSGFMRIYNGVNSDYPTGKITKPELNPSSFSTTTDYKAVRCVYDEWYWENTTFDRVTKTQFTWGDQAREDVVRTKAQ